MSENTPQGPYEANAGGPQQPPAYGGAGEPPAYGGQDYGTHHAGPPRVGEVLGFAWDRFKGNALFWVLFVLLTFVVSGIFNAGALGDAQQQLEALQSGDMAAMESSGTSAGSTSLQLLGSLVVSVLQALGIQAALREVSGHKATWGTLFKVESWGMVILAALLLMVANVVGLLLCGLGLIAVAIFAPFTYHNVVDKGMNAWDALTSSFRQVGQNFGAVFVLELALLGINIVGAILCGLGLFITVPLATLGMAYMYRRIAGGQVTA